MNRQHTNANQNENPESMKLSEPEPDKLTAESVENSYATHDGKNKCLIADLQSNIYHYTVHTDIISGLAAMISWSNTISQFNFIVVPTIEYPLPKKKNQVLHTN